MIQRIQSVLLLLAFILNGSVFFNALYRHAMDDPKGWIGIGFAMLLTVAGLASLACIFLYNNRPNQARWIKLTTFLQVVVIGWGIGIFISLGEFGSFLWDEALGLMMLIIALLAQLYARKKVNDDIELVKSMDRIR